MEMLAGNFFLRFQKDGLSKSFVPAFPYLCSDNAAFLSHMIYASSTFL